MPASGRLANHADERIAVKDNFFSQRSLTVQRGETVQWIWKGENRHNLTFRKVPKDTSERGAKTKRQGRWKRTFWRPGRYSYVCTIFAGMRGEITVAEPAGESRGSLRDLTGAEGRPLEGPPLQPPGGSPRT